MENISFGTWAIVSLLLYAFVDFLAQVLERVFYVQLVIGSLNFSSQDYAIQVRTCQTILLCLFCVCLVAFLVKTVIAWRNHK